MCENGTHSRKLTISKTMCPTSNRCGILGPFLSHLLIVTSIIKSYEQLNEQPLK